MAQLAQTTASREQQEQQDSRVARLRDLFELVFRLVMYVIIIFVFATPLIWALGNSFRQTEQIWGNLFPISWRTFIPLSDEFTVLNYVEALGFGAEARGLGYDMGNALWISVASALVVVGLSLIFNTCAAYFFARLRFPGKNFLLVFVIATMMIPQQITVIPLFFVVDQLNMINTFWALVVPFYASPFIIFALTQFFEEIPRELDEAATIDGANLFQILWRVIVPVSLPGLLTVSLLEFQFIWNNFYWPLVAVSSKELFPVNVALAVQFTDQVPQWGRVFAATVIASLPVVVLFAFLQRYYFESITISGMKG
ncbi:MAG: carbohydrate ABC transporter permease [Chloroflexota bacterium]